MRAPARQFELGVVNHTDIPIALFVNGGHIADFQPEPTGQTIESTVLPALPWNVEARSPGGLVLDTLLVDVGEITEAPGGRTNMTASGIGLACGDLELWAGTYSAVPTPGGPQPTAEFPQPCGP